MSRTTNKNSKANRKAGGHRVNNNRAEAYNSRRGISTRGRANDPSWYSKNVQLLSDVASLPFSDVLGQSTEIDTGSGTTVSNAIARFPGVMAIEYVPSIGTYEVNKTTAINISAQNVYSNVRYKNSGAANYDAPDLMMYILAADQVFSAISLAIRAYGIAKVYDQKNRYTPDALLTAMGFDPASVRANLAQFRANINLAIAKASVIWVPTNMPLIARHFWMNANIYKDSDDSKAQMYLYVPRHFWKFEPATSSTGSMLSVVDWKPASTSHTPASWFSMIEGLINPIITDEDCGIMAGDILKAYGESNIWSINEIPDDYTIMPVYEEEVLLQIHNATTIDTNSVPVKQNSNGVIYCDALTPIDDYQTSVPYNHFIDYIKGTPSPEMNMVATRMTQHPGLVSTVGGNAAMSIRCGTERAVSFNVYKLNADGTVGSPAVMHTVYRSSGTLSSGQARAVADFTKFDWAPMIYFVTTSGSIAASNYTATIEAMFGDVDYYSNVNAATISKMHDVAIMSELDVPSML